MIWFVLQRCGRCLTDRGNPRENPAQGIYAGWRTGVASYGAAVNMYIQFDGAHRFDPDKNQRNMQHAKLQANDEA